MAAFPLETPNAWAPEELSHGNRVLLAAQPGAVHLLAPPGVAMQSDEPTRSRAAWRYAIWEEDAEAGPPVIAIDEPSRVEDLSLSEVVDLLPLDRHDFVRCEMARQLCRAQTFGAPPAGGRPADRHAQLAGRTLSWAAAELAIAFPRETWFELEEPVVWIPETVEELLARMPEGDAWPTYSERRPRLRRFRVRWGRWHGRLQSEALVVLASALRGVGGRSQQLAVRCDRRAGADRYLVEESSDLTR